MGILSSLGLGKKRLDVLAAPQLSLLSPYAPEGNLAKLVAPEFGLEGAALPLGRTDALAIPSVARARHLLTGTIAKFPLKALDSNNPAPVKRQPGWINNTGTEDQTPFDRMAWTIDSCLFYGCALWVVQRGADGFPIAAQYLLQDEWEIRDRVIYLAGQKTPLNPRDYILFNPPVDGLLVGHQSNLRAARDVERSWQGRARNPIPLLAIKFEDELEQQEMDDYIATFSKARTAENGAVIGLPPGMSVEALGQVSADLMENGRNAVRTDIGNIVNIPASLLDGSVAQASLTYVTTEGNRNRFFDESVSFWSDPIAARLSADDVVPHGQRVRFDFYEQYNPNPTPTGAPTED